jgi:hypothetical protein
MNVVVLVAFAFLIVATYTVAPADIKISVVFAVAYTVYTVASVVTKKFQKKYYTMTDSFAVSGQKMMSHKDAHPSIRANA